MEKVKLPREVAEAIKKTKTKHPTWNNHDLCYIVLNRLGYCQYEKDEDISVIHKWSNTNELKFAKALLIGYEVEQTPEDEVRDMYARLDHSYSTEAAIGKGIVRTLDLLNIKIEGVNA